MGWIAVLMEKLGKPSFISIDDYVGFLYNLVRTDEIKRALEMANNPPAYFRNDPKIEEFKKNIYTNLWTVFDYAKDPDESLDATYVYDDYERSNFNHTNDKVIIVANQVKRFEENPSILDVCCGAEWLNVGLKKRGLSFYYESLSVLNDKRRVATSVNNIDIFVCYEVIEHLWSPEYEIQHWFYKYAPKARSIVMSTPNCTLSGGMEEIERDLGHVKTYDMHTFVEFCSKTFPKDFTWSVAPGFCLMVVGER